MCIFRMLFLFHLFYHFKATFPHMFQYQLQLLGIRWYGAAGIVPFSSLKKCFNPTPPVAQQFCPDVERSRLPASDFQTGRGGFRSHAPKLKEHCPNEGQVSQLAMSNGSHSSGRVLFNRGSCLTPSDHGPTYIRVVCSGWPSPYMNKRSRLIWKENPGSSNLVYPDWRWPL